MLFERLASRVLGTDGSLRASAETIAANELGQPGLWPHAISGDLPILLVRVVGDDDVPLVRQVLQAQEYWRLKGLSADVVILNEHPISYLDEMQAQLTAVLEDGPWSTWQHRPGRRLSAARRPHGPRRTRAARSRGARDSARRPRRPAHAARSARPDAAAGDAARADGAAARRHARPPMVPCRSMTLTNGLGGFTDDGRAYAIVLDGAEETPMPWANVIANPQFGTIVTASGAAHTWSGNSRENRLTPFANDPVSDPTARGDLRA